jgi:hypothetical protein
MARVWAYDEAVWRGNILCAGDRPLVRLEPEETHPGMWLVVRQDWNSF